MKNSSDAQTAAGPMNIFINMSLSKKLGLGFFAITAILIGVVLINANQVKGTATVSTRVTEIRTPTAMASMNIQNGINQALAALRGWMLLGKEGFKGARTESWENGIWPAFKVMKEKSRTWTNPENVKRLKRIETLLPEFERAQKEIEDIAQTEDNVPSIKMLIHEAAPQATIIVSNITRMIDLEMKQQSSPERKQLLGMMADVRGTMGLSLANIRAYLLSGDAKFRTNYEKLWAKNERRYKDLSNNTHLLTSEQRSAYDTMTNARDIFAPIPPTMLGMRGQEDWNVGNHWLGTKAAPIGKELSTILKAMVKDQQGLLTKDAALIQKKTNDLIRLGWIMLAIGVALASAFGFFITRYLVNQIGSVVEVADQIAAGNLDNDININSTDETGQLLRSFDIMQTNLKETIDGVQVIAQGALAGNLNERIDLNGKKGFYEELGNSINELVDVNERVINETVKVVSAMAEGDLNKSFIGEYAGSFEQLKQDANTTVSKLTEVINEIKRAAEEVRTGATEITIGNTDLSQRTEEQASSLEETASSMEELTGTVKQNADNAQTANQLASSAREQAEKGGEVVNKAVSAMNEINTASGKIADIIGVIDEIAFQTNLLALNAAVEAARAGEQGRGFAVVASEVRSLAQRSAEAAKEIKVLINDSVDKVEEGSKLVDDSGKTLEEIVMSVKKVNDIIAEIAAASEEQSTGINQINEAVTQMDEMTQQNAALVEEATAASKSMDQQASGLSELVAFFNTGDNSKSAITAADRRLVDDRPWSEKSESSSEQPVNEPLKKAATGGDSEWEEF